MHARAVHGGPAGGHGRRVGPVPGEVLSTEDTGHGHAERKDTAEQPGAERHPQEQQTDGHAPRQQHGSRDRHEAGHLAEADVGELPGHVTQPVGLCGPCEGDRDPVDDCDHRGGDQPRQERAEGESDNRVGDDDQHAHKRQPQGVETRGGAAARKGDGRGQQ